MSESPRFLLVEFCKGHISISPQEFAVFQGGEAMSDRRRFLKGLTSLPLATVLANPRLAAASGQNTGAGGSD
jgi:hypothetical protein